jgi:hypothetical protein
MWCDEHPERHGSTGANGAPGLDGVPGEEGPWSFMDAFQILPITEEQWYQEFNQPHILFLLNYWPEPEQTVAIGGQNFDPSIDRVYFDGVDVGPVESTMTASFVVPTTSEGGWHPIVIRGKGGKSSPKGSERRSNKVMALVIPRLDAIPECALNDNGEIIGRWVEHQSVTLTGLAFRPGLKVLAEDWSGTTPISYSLPVDNVKRTSIDLTIPGAPLGDVRGVRRIVVQNPDNGKSRDERVARISDTIVVRCAAFRVIGPDPSFFEPFLSTSEIASLFAEDGPLSLSVYPWSQARIVFKLVQPVKEVVGDDNNSAATWPSDPDDDVQRALDLQFFHDRGGVPGALNFFFFYDVEKATAYAWKGTGLIFIGTTDGQAVPDAVDIQQIVAHEAGHAMCLDHVCPNAGEEPEDTLFGRECIGADNQNLMYPYWDTSDGMGLTEAEVDTARIGATHFEDGKTSLSNPFESTSTCESVDTDD